MMPGIIVTGVDNSETALKAAEKAASLAEAFGSDLHLVSAYNVSVAETFRSVRSQNPPEAMADAYRSTVTQHTDEAERTVSHVAETLRAQFPQLTIVAKAIEGATGVAVSDEAERVGADLIVVGNKRVQGPTRIFGSVARDIAAATDCDLYVVNTHQR